MLCNTHCRPNTVYFQLRGKVNYGFHLITDLIFKLSEQKCNLFWLKNITVWLDLIDYCCRNRLSMLSTVLWCWWIKILVLDLKNIQAYRWEMKTAFMFFFLSYSQICQQRKAALFCHAWPLFLTIRWTWWHLWKPSTRQLKLPSWLLTWEEPSLIVILTGCSFIRYCIVTVFSAADVVQHCAITVESPTDSESEPTTVHALVNSATHLAHLFIHHI